MNLAGRARAHHELSNPKVALGGRPRKLRPQQPRESNSRRLRAPAPTGSSSPAFLKAAPPTTLDGIERYLGSGMIKDIGPVYASKLVQAFAEGVFGSQNENTNVYTRTKYQPTQSTALPVSASACRSPTCLSANAGSSRRSTAEPI